MQWRGGVEHELFQQSIPPPHNPKVGLYPNHRLRASRTQALFSLIARNLRIYNTSSSTRLP